MREPKIFLAKAFFFVLMVNSPQSAYAYCSEPSEPSCLDTLGLMQDEMWFNMCRSEVASYVSDVEDYIGCRIREVKSEQTDLTQKANEAIERFNCYASGNSFCY